MPRVGHFHAVLHVFSYLQNNVNKEILMDAAEMDNPEILKAEWKEFYPWEKDEIPPDMPKPLGVPVKITIFVGASQASNVVTSQSRTGVLFYVNRVPIIWYLKKQNLVETSSFRSEFAALKQGFELLEGLPIDGYCYTCVDNKSFICNTSRPESMLMKKSNSIAYNYV